MAILFTFSVDRVVKKYVITQGKPGKHQNTLSKPKRLNK